MGKRFLVLGAGRQGAACAAFLLEQFADTHVDFVDNSPPRLEAACRLQRHPQRVTGHGLDVQPAGAVLRSLMAEADCVVSCVPYLYNATLTAEAIAAGTSFCDMGGNVGTVQAQMALADKCRAAGVTVMPDCGLAPGLLNILGEYWAGSWEYQAVKLYCGGLPQNPRGILQYAMTFSIHGLLNEYLDDCQVARGGKVATVAGLGELERVSGLALPGEFEAFATSGGASLGPQVYAPRGVDYQYKTIRYPGHAAIIQALRELGLFETAARSVRVGENTADIVPRDLVGQIMESALRSDGKDLIVGRAEVRGRCAGVPRTGRVELIDYAVDRFTAMERTTGFSTAIVAAALAGLYGQVSIAPGTCVPFQVMDPGLVISELKRAGVVGLTVREE